MIILVSGILGMLSLDKVSVLSKMETNKRKKRKKKRKKKRRGKEGGLRKKVVKKISRAS